MVLLNAYLATGKRDEAIETINIRLRYTVDFSIGNC